MVKNNVAYPDAPIITVKEARKTLGKKLSGKLSDECLMGIIMSMSNLASCLFDHDYSSNFRKGMIR